MKIRLRKGKQQELIISAKKNLTWKEFSEKVGIPESYLCNDIKSEKILLKEDKYKLICSLIGENFDKFIIDRLPDNWGKSKGGLNSLGSTIKLIPPKRDEKLAEFIGALLGDGNLSYYKKGKKIGVYQIRIAGDLIKDKDYHMKYLKNLCEKVFNLKVNEIIREKHNERFLVLYSKELIEFFNCMGIKPGNKITNQSTIPNWIFKDKKYMRACIRGLIDTDGCIHRMSNRDYNLMKIDFTNHNITLLNDTRKAFVKLGFNPSKIILNRRFVLSRQEEIRRYIREIGFKNPKHFLKLPEFGIAL